MVGRPVSRDCALFRTDLKIHLHRFLIGRSNQSAMTARKLIAQLAVVLAILGGFNLIVQREASNSIPRQLVRALDSTSGISVLVLGNSLIADGFNAAVFEESLAPQPTKALNAGLGSSDPVVHFMLLRRALR